MLRDSTAMKIYSQLSIIRGNGDEEGHRYPKAMVKKSSQNTEQNGFSVNFFS
jgi:hypothetical protein